MESFDFGSTNILNRILLLEGYLNTRSEEDLKNGKGVEKDSVNENDLVELAEKFEESNDTSAIEEAVKSISKLMDLNANGVIDNDELQKFQGILEKLGLSANEILSLYDKFNIKVSSDVDNIDAAEFENITLEDFKEILSAYPKLNELAEEVGYKKLFSLIDKNGNDTIDEEELDAVTTSSGGDKSLSFSSIKKLLEDNGIDIKDFGELITKELKDIDDEKELIARLRKALGIEDDSSSDNAAPVDTMAQQAVAPAASSGGYYPSSGGYSSGGSYSGGSSGGVSSASTETAKPNTETIEELERSKTEKQGELETLNSNLSSVLDGSDSEIEDKKTAMDDAEEEYKQLLEEDANNNEEVKALKEELEGVEKDIEENEKNINDTEEALNKKGQEISAKENEISGLESEKSALESSLSALNAIQINDKNKDEVEAKKKSVEDQISKKEDEIKRAKEELETLEDEKDDLEEALDEYKDAKTDLETQRKEIEDNIEKTASEATKEALGKYQDARDAYESAKETRLTAVKGEIETKQAEITEIEGKIQELKAAEIEKENQVGPYAQYNAERGQALADAANSLYGNVSKGGGYCATGVSQAINKAFGYATHGNGCDYGNVLSGLEDWTEITDQISSASDLVNLPAGAIVSWSPYNTSSLGRLYGHVYIADGQGHEISDFKSNITTYYADRGSQYRVFIPT